MCYATTQRGEGGHEGEKLNTGVLREEDWRRGGAQTKQASEGLSARPRWWQRPKTLADVYGVLQIEIIQGFVNGSSPIPGRLPVAPCEGSQERRRGTWPWKRYCYNVNTWWSSCSASLATDLLQSHEVTLKKSNKTRVFSVFNLAFNQCIFHFFPARIPAI